MGRVVQVKINTEYGNGKWDILYTDGFNRY